MLCLIIKNIASNKNESAFIVMSPFVAIFSTFSKVLIF
jgi:hypothetical protein